MARAPKRYDYSVTVDRLSDREQAGETLAPQIQQGIAAVNPISTNAAALGSAYIDQANQRENPIAAPLARGWEGFKDTALQRYEDVQNAEGLELADVAASNLAAMPVDVFSTMATTLLDIAVPGTPMEDAAKWAADTEEGQRLTRLWASMPEEDQRNVRTGLAKLDAIGVGKLLKPFANAIAPNANSFVKDFYTGNLILKAVGAGEAVGVGAIRAFKEAINPKHIASRRKAGITVGLREEIADMVEVASNATRINRINKINEKRAKQGKAPIQLSPEEARIADFMNVMGNGNPQKAASYIEGALLAKYNILLQSGEDPGVLRDLVEGNLYGAVTNASDRSGIKTELFHGSDVPEGVQDRLTNNLVNIHLAEGKKDEWVKGKKAAPDSYVAVRNPDGQTNLAGERAGQPGTYQGQLFELRRPFQSEQDMNRFFHSMNLDAPDRKWYREAGLELENGNLLVTPKQQQRLDRIHAEAAAREEVGKPPYTQAMQKTVDNINAAHQKNMDKYNKLDEKIAEKPYQFSLTPDKDGFIYFYDTHHSAAKELGGVRGVTAFNPKTGQVIGAITDRHDIFGRDPIGGKGLITITSPVTYNAYEASHKGGLSNLGLTDYTSHSDAVARSQANTGVDPIPVVGGRPQVRQAAGIARDYWPTPDGQDYARAAANAGLLTGTAGYAGTRDLISNYQEETQ